MRNVVFSSLASTSRFCVQPLEVAFASSRAKLGLQQRNVQPLKDEMSLSFSYEDMFCRKSTASAISAICDDKRRLAY